MKELASLNRYLWQYKWPLLVGLVFVIVSNFFAIQHPIIVRKTLNKVEELVKEYNDVSANGGEIDMNAAMESFIYFGLTFLLVALIGNVFLFLVRQMIIVTSRKIEKELKDDIYAHLQRLSLSFYRKTNTGDIMARLTEDVSSVRMYLGPGIMYTINFTSNIILVLIAMFSVNTELTLYVLIPMPFLAVSIYFVNQIIHKRSTDVQEQMSRISTYVQEMYSGIRVIKAFAAEVKLSKTFEEESEDYKYKSLKLVQVNALFIPLIILLIGICNLITIYIGGQLYIRGEASAGNIAEFFMYVGRLTWPVAAVGWVTAVIQRAAASQKRINAFMKIEPEIVAGTTVLNPVEGRLRFDNVGFTYKNTGIRAIDSFDLEVKPGEVVGVIGKTGSGKSSLIHLLMRQFDVDQGQISIDDVPIKTLDLGKIRSQIGYVPQDNFLFADSIKNNVYWGGEGQSEDKEELYEVTEIADLKKDIDDLDDGFETILGERGISLSGGQKQRLSIARAIYGNPKVVVFDDSFSAVDTQTEAAILASLGEYLKNRTTILVAHRVSTVKNADQIIVMDKGRIVEKGRHEELITNKQYYYSLYRKQLLEKELES